MDSIVSGIKLSQQILHIDPMLTHLLRRRPSIGSMCRVCWVYWYSLLMRVMCGANHLM